MGLGDILNGSVNTVSEVVNESSSVFAEVVVEVGKIGLWLQTLGLIVIVWLAFMIVSLILNRKKKKALYTIKDDLVRIEKKIDKLLKNQKVFIQ